MTFSFTGGSVSKPQDIDELEGKLLLVCHNALTGKETKKFSCRSAGNVQTRKAFATWCAQQPKGKVDPLDQKTYRPDSNRGKIIELASKAGGATVASLKAETKWDDADLNNALARIQDYNGLTVNKTGEGDEAIVVISGQIRKRRAFALDPKKEQKAHKEGTKRATVLALLKEGATFDSVKEATGWDDRTAYEGIRLLNGYLGYGLKETPDGRIFVYTK